MESQLKQQGAADRMDEVLDEIPRVREDLGFIPLVTPTSQIVGSQAVINVLSGKRYASISKETQGVLKGEYGATPAPVNAELQARVLDGAKPITCRPADLIEPELAKLAKELKELAATRKITLAQGENEIDDVLTYTLFNQVGLKFLENRNNPAAFEPAPTGKESAAVKAPSGEEVYTVQVAGQSYTVTVSDGGELTGIVPLNGGNAAAAAAVPATGGTPVIAPLAGNIVRVLVKPGQTVQEGEVVVMLEAMKMETEISAHAAGVVTEIHVKDGDVVTVGDTLLSIG